MFASLLCQATGSSILLSKDLKRVGAEEPVPCGHSGAAEAQCIPVHHSLSFPAAWWEEGRLRHIHRLIPAP